MASPEIWAECPFTITIAGSSSKKRHRPGDDEDATDSNAKRHKSPFEPWGKFKTHATMDVSYHVSPSRKWAKMTRYKRFVRTYIYRLTLPCQPEQSSNDTLILQLMG